MKCFFLIIMILFFSVGLNAQSVDSVKNVIESLFHAMKTADSARLTQAFTDSAILQTIEKNKSGEIKVRTDGVLDFAKFLATQKSGNLNEQITFDIVKVDDDLAMAWTPYMFFYKGKFSHCGVNSFQLVRIKNVWKIQYLIDTRRTKGCTDLHKKSAENTPRR